MSKFNYYNRYSITILSLIFFTTSVTSQQSPTFPPGLCCLEPPNSQCEDVVCNEFDLFCCQTQWDDQCKNIAYRICYNLFNFTSNATTFEPTTTTLTQTTNIPTRSPTPTTTQTATTTATTEAGLCCAYPLDDDCKEYVCNHVDPDGPVCCEIGWDGYCDSLAYGVCYPFNISSTVEPSISLQPTITSTATQTQIPTIIPSPMPTPIPTKAPAIITTTIPTPMPGHFWWKPAANPCCDCVRPSEFAGCPGKKGCEDRICSRDRFCCATEWDIVCALKSDAICKGIETAKCCECTNHQSGRGGCVADRECEMQICNADPFCCYARWDLRCANTAVNICVQQSKLQY